MQLDIPPHFFLHVQKETGWPERKSTPKGDFVFPLWKPLKTTKRAPALLDFPARRTTVKRFGVRCATHCLQPLISRLRRQLPPEGEALGGSKTHCGQTGLHCVMHRTLRLRRDPAKRSRRIRKNGEMDVELSCLQGSGTECARSDVSRPASERRGMPRSESARCRADASSFCLPSAFRAASSCA